MTTAPGSSGSPRVLIVVPTLGRRPEYLYQTLASIREQKVPVEIAIVAPVGVPSVVAAAREFAARLVPDPGSLPGAINLGASECLGDHDYLNWLNDDDLLVPGSLAATVQALDSDPGAVVAFGACRYIDAQGNELWLSRAGAWAPRILSWGPDLIPQPGMLIRSSAWRAVGGVDESYRLAFDLDLLLRLRRVGRLISVNRVVSSFRWHPDSLTVDDRSANLAESERAKRAALSPLARRCAWIWEPPVRFAIRRAASSINRRSQSAPRTGRGPSEG